MLRYKRVKGGESIEEIWKEINGYKISNYGTIIGRKGEPLSKKPDKRSGYLTCSINLGKPYGIVNGQHRVVGIAFCEGYNKDLQINHKDANKGNNRADNLEWVTNQGNMNHVSDNRLNPRSSWCCEIDKNGKIIEIYVSQSVAERKTIASVCNIFLCCHGKRDSAKGHRFRFYNENTNEYVKTKFDDTTYKYRSTTRKSIRCIETNVVYLTQMDASRDLKINQSEISNYLNGKRKHPIDGLTFEYV